MISEFPLFVFTTLGGLAAGTYIMAAIFPNREHEDKRTGMLPLVCLVLLGLGLLGCLGHLGRPMMFLNALANPTSMITEEAYFSIAFGIVLLIDVIFCFAKGRTLRALRIIGAVFGAGLVIVMANAYFTSNAVAAWNFWPTWPLFIVGDLLLGIGLYSVLDFTSNKKKSFAWTEISLAALFAIAAILDGIHFGDVNQNASLLYVGAVLSILGGAVAALGLKQASKRNACVVIACILLIVSVAIARYGFYAASIL